MTGIATRTGSRLGIGILISLMLIAMLAIPAMAHDAKVDFGIQAITITSAQRTTLGRVAVKGTVTCSKTTSGVGVGAYVRQVAGRTDTIRGEGYRTIRCVAGTKVPFSVTVTPDEGKFVGGKALVQAEASKVVESFNEETGVYHFHYDFAVTEREINLTR